MKHQLAPDVSLFKLVRLDVFGLLYLLILHRNSHDEDIKTDPLRKKSCFPPFSMYAKLTG